LAASNLDEARSWWGGNMLIEGSKKETIAIQINQEGGSRTRRLTRRRVKSKTLEVLPKVKTLRIKSGKENEKEKRREEALKVFLLEKLKGARHGTKYGGRRDCLGGEWRVRTGIRSYL